MNSAALVRIVDVWTASTRMYAILHRYPVMLNKDWSQSECDEYLRIFYPEIYWS